MVSVMPPNLGGFFNNSFYSGVTRGHSSYVSMDSASQYWPQNGGEPYDMSKGSGGPPKVRSRREKLQSSVMMMPSEAVIGKSATLYVDCSVEYELPKIPKIPSDSLPLLKVCPGYERPKANLQTQLEHPSPLTPSEEFLYNKDQQLYFQQRSAAMWPAYATSSWLPCGGNSSYPFMMSTPYPSPYMTPLGMAPMNSSNNNNNSNNNNSNNNNNNNGSVPCGCTACRGAAASKVAPVMSAAYPVTKEFMIHSGRYRSV
ncbi:hypothetical protein TCAL_16193 [Tigriopus californicus]|uniref:Uncharacterized protein n=1 Tax=Tigriopus californicus TaxID=6832 RepID=A0A553P327_TIGCA|nr:hypothetical protein TCAL_16193 [Tigriopus californicus]